jgi:hypothetical protein
MTRRAMHKRDSDITGTFFSHALSEADLPQGRFTANQKSALVGSEGFEYPRLPESSWVNQDAGIPPEPGLGFSVDATEPVGTAAELRESVEGMISESSIDSPISGELRSDAGPSDVVEPRSPLPKRRRKG